MNIEKLPQEIEENKNTPEDALGCIDKTKETWNKKENILALFVSHRELDEIGALLETLHSAALSSDSGHYASTLAVLKERLKKLSVSEGFSAVSIL